jgi:tripartite-type tricarboxylate transporter receptor subunit TctC
MLNTVMFLNNLKKGGFKIMKVTSNLLLPVLVMLLVISAGSDSILSSKAYAQTKADVSKEFPTKPISLVVSWTAGGGTDLSARIFTSFLEKYLPTKVIVANKAGGGGSIGAQYVAAEKPDGYTLLFTSQSLVLSTYETKGRVSHEDFRLIGVCSEDAFGILVRKDAPWKTFDEFIRHIKNNPGKVTIGSTGVGSYGYLSITQMEKAAGAKFQSVPFPGSAQAFTNTLGGHVDCCSVPSSDATTLLKAGELRMLGIGSERRSVLLPDVPTYKEMGTNVVSVIWRGVLVHKDTPRPVVNILREAIGKALHLQAYKDKMIEAGFVPDDLTDEGKLQELMKKEDKMASEMHRESGSPPVK